MAKHYEHNSIFNWPASLIYYPPAKEAPLKTGFSDLPPDPGRSRIDKPTVWIPYIWMVGTLQLQSPECVSEVLSMREREVANLGSDGVLVLLIRLGLANYHCLSLGIRNSEIHKLSY
jgi:hypothetical protein